MSRQDDRDELAGLALRLTSPRRPGLILSAWHWRYEIAVAVGAAVAIDVLWHAIGLGWLLVLVAGLASMVWHWPAARRFVAVRSRVVIVQHRLRTAFARARICTLEGKLPAIVWTTPDDDEIRVLVACPAGIGADRFEAERQVLAGACFAADVEVAVHPRYANMIVLTVRTAG